MRIFCVGRNYVNHTKELKNDVPEQPIIFFKQEESLLKNNRPFYIPAFSDVINYECEIVVRIDRVGKNIQEKFAHRYYSQIAIGIDMTARDLQAELSSKGLPWEISKAFDNSAPISNFYPISNFSDSINNIDFSLKINNKIVQKGNTADMLFSVDQIIAYLSKYFTLKIGDLIFTGTPEGVGKVNIGDHLEAFIKKQKLLDFYIK
ncbi:MAG: fumarylacetoacetate hydrolase family protein [Marinilabiliales bacterium]